MRVSINTVYISISIYTWRGNVFWWSRSNFKEKKYKMIRMVWLGGRQKTSGTQLLAHTYCKPERKLHPLNNNSEWKVFSSFIVFFFFPLSTLPLWWMVKHAGVGFLWYASPHVSFGRVLAAFGRNRQSQSLSSADPEIVQVSDWRCCLDRARSIINSID